MSSRIEKEKRDSFSPGPPDFSVLNNEFMSIANIININISKYPGRLKLMVDETEYSDEGNYEIIFIDKKSVIIPLGS